jgi:Protein of unknown function (DUF2721)
MQIGQLMETSDFKLAELLSGAAATTGIIVAGTIFLSFLSSKGAELAGRYRALTSEYRGGGAAEARHGVLQSQIRVYRRRLRLMNWAFWVAIVGLECFLAAVLAGGINKVYPSLPCVTSIGAFGLFAGMVLIGIALALELCESALSRKEIADEVNDLDDPPNAGRW